MLTSISFPAGLAGMKSIPRAQIEHAARSRLILHRLLILHVSSCCATCSKDRERKPQPNSQPQRSPSLVNGAASCKISPSSSIPSICRPQVALSARRCCLVGWIIRGAVGTYQTFEKGDATLQWNCTESFTCVSAPRSSLTLYGTHRLAGEALEDAVVWRAE